MTGHWRQAYRKPTKSVSTSTWWNIKIQSLNRQWKHLTMYICVPKQDSKSFLVDLNLLWASCKPPSTIGKSAGVKWTCGEMFPMLSGSLFHSIFFKQAKALHIQPGLSDSLQADTLGMSTKRIGAPNFPTNPFRNALELKQEVRGSFLPPGCYSLRNWGSTYWSGSPTLSSFRLP